MNASAFVRSRSKTWTRLLAGVLFASSLARLSAQIVPGTNVNMVAGRTWPDGDPFLQRQNEPSIAVSSRNVLHLVAGANDYRTVDLPGLPADKPTGDSWLGLFKSLDGGQTWKSTLVPGYPQDTSPGGVLSPLKGFDAAADPTVRAAANGLFFYSGIAFQRAAIVDNGAIRAGIGANKRDVQGGKTRREKANRESRQSRQQARERERERERERDREKKKARDRARKVGTRGGSPAPLEQPLSRIGGGAEEDEEEAGVESATASAVFVSTLIDLNNLETGDPVSYVRTTLVDHDNGTRFLDKQWMAVDVPRAGAQMCVLDAPRPGLPAVRQAFLGGRIYVVYTAFTGSGSSMRGQILFSYSADCGATWTRPHDLSTALNPDVNGDGIVNTADLNSVKASFGKRCGDTGFNPSADVNGDCLVDVVDLASVSRSIGTAVSTIRRVPQGAAIAINPVTGAVYVAWREFKAGNLPAVIQFVSSSNSGSTFTKPQTVAAFSPFDQGSTETSFRTSAFPTMTSDGNRIYLAWAARGFATSRPDPTTGDARVVMTTSTNGTAWTLPRAIDDLGVPGHQIMPALAFGAGKLSLLYYDLREDVSRLFGPFVDELPILTANPPLLRHTIDARIAQANPGPQPIFESVQLSEYATGVMSLSGVTVAGGPLQQLQFNPPNLTIFRHGSTPFMGDYIDLAASPTIRSNADGTWAFNIEPQTSAAGHAVWADNRDVRAGPNGDLSNYTPPLSESRRSTSLFDPSQAVAPCVADLTGTRDQNIYTARFDQGLFAAALGNSKPLGSIQRAFALTVENATALVRSYRLTITNQPPGGQASFDQFSAAGSARTVLDVSIPPHSTIARTAYVTSTDSQARVVIDVSEIAAPDDPALRVGGLRGAITLNGDPTAPRIDNPRIDNPRIDNKDINTAEVVTPEIGTAQPAPRIDNPRIDNPRIDNPRIDNLSDANPSIVNPRIDNPRIDNSGIVNPRIDNPRIDNPDLVNGSISDTTWELTNVGNTAAAYAVKLLLNQAIPEGFKTQLIIHKTYTTPAADGCVLKQEVHNVVVVNITTPAFDTPADVGNPRIDNPRIDNASVALTPGETANVTLRVFDPDKNDQVTFTASAAVTPAAVAQTVNTEDVRAGIAQPPVAISVTITTAQLPDAFLTGALYQQTLQANVLGTWTITAGTLPPGLTLTAATGRIAGVPTVAGTYPFTVTFTDTATPPHTVSQSFVIHVGGPLAIATTTLPGAVANDPYSVAITATGGVGALTWTLSNGTLPTGLSLNATTGTISGTPTSLGSFGFTVTVRDRATPQNSVSQIFTLNVTATTGTADVGVVLSASPNPVAAGSTLTYTMTVTNTSATNQASGVTANQTLPPGVTFVSATGGPSCSLLGSVVVCGIGTLNPSASVALTIQVTPDVGGVTLVSNAYVDSTTTDDNTANDGASVTTTVTGSGTRQLWVADGGTPAAISIVNPDTNTAAGTIGLAAPANDVTFSPNGQRAYVVNFTTGNVAVIDTATNTVVDNLSVTDPVRAKVSPDGSKFYVSNGPNQLSVFSTQTDALITAIAVGGAPAGLAVSPDGLRVYVANRTSNSLSVINAATNTVIATVPVGDLPAGVAVTPNGKRVFVSNSSDSTVSVIDTRTNTVVATLTVARGPQDIAVAPNGLKAYVANFDADAVSVITVSDNVVSPTIAVGGSPNGVVVSPDGDRVYVTAYNAGAVRVLDTGTNTVVTSVAAGSLPIAVDYARSSTGPIASATPSAVTFGTQALTITRSQSVIVRNVGTGVLTIGNGTLVGPNAAEFQANLGGCSSASLGPNASCTLSLSFAPVTEGAKAAVYQLSVSLGPSPLQIDLSGTGLSALHRVIGRVADAASGQPILNATVNVYNNDATQVVATLATDVAGTYVTPLLADGGYRAKAGAAGYVDQLYQNISCALGCTISGGTGISLPMISNPVRSVDFALSPPSPSQRVTGRVTDASNGQPIANAAVTVYNAAGTQAVATVSTGPGGVYGTATLPNGAYRAKGSAAGYADQLYKNISCALGCTISTGTGISLPWVGTPPSVDFSLSLLTSVAGTVSNAETAAAANVTIQLYDGNGTLKQQTTTDGGGHYQFSNIPKGTYYERTINTAGYLDKVFDDISCALGCDVKSMIAITASVRASAIVSNVPPAVANFFLPLNTPAGSNVAVAPPLPSGDAPVTITFANVTAPGKTMLTVPSSGAPLPAGYTSGTPPIFYDIATTGVFDTGLVCVTSAPGTFQNNSAARLLQLVGGAWNDVTTQVNQVTRVVCGSVTNLGSFTVAQSTNFVVFNVTGGVQTWTVPAGVTTVDIDASGASGESRAGPFVGGGGKGGRLQTTVAVTPGETLFIYVGGTGLGGVGGFNGGGQGGSGTSQGNGGGGAGASDIRRNPGGLSDRLAVAGGGGGGAGRTCSSLSGGAGGGVTGGTSGKCFSGSGIIAASGGSQTAGGTGGSSFLGNSGTSGSAALGGNGGSGSDGGGGGGGGYFGGGGGGANMGNGGGGGSGFSSGTNTAQTQGFNNGNGHVVITPRP